MALFEVELPGPETPVIVENTPEERSVCPLSIQEPEV